MAQPTRTLNPLHFEDFDPHRFEDLVRQLAYEFRQWRTIEAIGRPGGEEGMDIRAMERVDVRVDSDSDADVEDEEEAPPAAADHLWVIQCKREKAIGPAKVKKILGDFFKQDVRPYGYILSAACDISKKTRDAAAEILRANGVQEFQFWGKGELEDMLVQPKNDHLLFAYFNISLQVRRRSMRTDLRSRLTLKRKLVKVMGGNIDTPNFQAVLIRDPQDDRYPYVGDASEFVKNPKWRYYQFHKHEHDGISVVTREYFAYVDWETEQYDFTKAFNLAQLTTSELHGVERSDWDPTDQCEVARSFFELHVPEVNRARAVEVGVIPFEQILLVDELGDRFNNAPHILVETGPSGTPFTKFGSFLRGQYGFVDRELWHVDEKKRFKIFPEQLPDEREKLQEHLKKKWAEEDAAKKRPRT